MHTLIERSLALVVGGTLVVGGAAAYREVVSDAQVAVAKTNAEEVARHTYTYSMVSDSPLEDVLIELGADQTGPNSWVYKNNARIEWDGDTNVVRSIVGGECYEATVGIVARPNATPCTDPFVPQGPTAEEHIAAIDATIAAIEDGSTALALSDGTATFVGEDGTCYTVRITDGVLGDVAEC